jgi:anti-sigma B factor antagonist
MSAPDPDDLVIEVLERPGGVLLRLVGDVDVMVVSRLRDALNDALIGDSDRVVLDLADLRWIDSVGIGVVVAAWKRGRAAGTALVLWRPSTKAQAILRLSRLDRVMTVLPDDAEDPFAA